jgi:hypothetical protein
MNKGQFELGAQTYLVDAVEQARGITSWLARRDEQTLVEFHTNAFRRAFVEVGPASAYRLGLSTMKLLGEIQPLEAGYWLPTPVRSVPLLGGHSLLISPATTWHLRREFPSTQRAGLSRVAIDAELTSLPQQPLTAWLGTDPSSLLAWSEHVLRSCASSLQRSAPRPGLEFFQVRENDWGDQPRRGFAWTSTSANALRLGERMHLCRERVGPNAMTFCVVEMMGGSVFAEAPLSASPQLFQYAVAAAAGTPAQFALDEEADTFRVAMASPLPPSTYRLFEAIGKKDSREGKRRRYEFDTRFMPQVTASLNSIHCERVYR